MRRKNRKWVLTAVAFYLLVIVLAYRWAVEQRPSDGPIFEHIQREEVRKLHERNAKEAQAQAQAQAQPTGESRLKAAGPAFVAARYDDTHVVFIVTADTESRFSPTPLIRLSATPTRIPAAPQPAAPLAGLDELYEPDSHSLHFFPEIVQKTHVGDQWSLNLSPDSSIPVVIERPVLAPTGCSLALGFLASVPPDQQAAFARSSREYFAVRRNPVESADPPVASHIAELPLWKPSPAFAQQIEQQLTDRMKHELAQIDARLLANAASPGATAGELPIGNAHPRLKEWIHADRGLARGEGTLDYDIRAFRLTPDAAPRLFVRARWTLVNAPVFLMTAWFKTDEFKADAQPILLSADSSWSTSLREGQASATLGDTLDFQSILNEFDADHDGWAEVLVHSYDAQPHDAHSNQSPYTAITLELYTDLGLVPLKSPLLRDSQSPQSCIDP